VRETHVMLIPSVVTIVVNGTIVTATEPARIRDGRVVAPIAPILVRLASRVAYDAPSATVTLDRGSRHLVVAVAVVIDEVPFVELAPVVRALGESAAFDAATKTLTIAVAADDAITTPRPFDPRAPQVAPTSVFTPPPRQLPSPAAATGVPHPRRTAIPAVPSQPVATASPDEIKGRRR